MEIKNNSLTNRQEKISMSKALASTAVAELGKNLNLTTEQLMKARTTALSLSTNDKLKDCDPYSLIKYCFEIARFNFTRDDCCYPVPYNGKVQAQISYKGFCEIAMRSNKYEKVDSNEVRECDLILRDENTGDIYVNFNKDYNLSKNSKIVGYYAFAKNKEGKIVNSYYMSLEDCEKHGKRYSKSYNKLWGDKDYGFYKMSRKTTIKMLCNKLDTSSEMQDLIKTDQLVFGTENEKNQYLDNKTNFFDNNIFENEVIDVEETKLGEVIDKN